MTPQLTQLQKMDCYAEKNNYYGLSQEELDAMRKVLVDSEEGGKRMTIKKIFDMPKEPSYELEVLDLAQDSHASDEENAKSDVWVWSEREHDDNLERLKETQQKFITRGKETRIVKVTRRILK